MEMAAVHWCKSCVYMTTRVCSFQRSSFAVSVLPFRPLLPYALPATGFTLSTITKAQKHGKSGKLQVRLSSSRLGFRSWFLRLKERTIRPLRVLSGDPG